MTENKKAWDSVFKEQGRVFQKVHPDVMRLSLALQPAATKRVLDLGSGSGRHVIHLAKAGFAVHGFDNSPQGIDLTSQWLKDENLEAKLHLGDMTEALPFEANLFDAVVSVQVIHHARLETVEEIVAEIVRILKPEGTILITVPSLRNQAQAFDQIAPNTFVPLEGWEKGLPHYIFDEAQLRKSFAQFDIHTIHLDDTEHYSLWATLKASLV